MLNAAIAAQGRVGLMLNARKADLETVIGRAAGVELADDVAVERSGVGGAEYDSG